MSRPHSTVFGIIGAEKQSCQDGGESRAESISVLRTPQHLSIEIWLSFSAPVEDFSNPRFIVICRIRSVGNSQVVKGQAAVQTTEITLSTHLNSTHISAEHLYLGRNCRNLRYSVIAYLGRSTIVGAGDKSIMLVRCTSPERPTNLFPGTPRQCINDIQLFLFSL